MGKFALIATVGEKDEGIKVDDTQYRKSAILPFEKYKNSSDVSIHTFLTSLKQRKLEPSEVAMDLLVIACSMYAADTRIERKQNGEDGWTRIIDLYIPVSDPVVWNSQKELLEKIFKFLTGDVWKVFFRERADKDLLLSPKGTYARYKMPYVTDTVCLFSGGMDSFIGAINLLANGTRPLLLGHSKSGDVSSYQEKAALALAKEYSTIPPDRIDAFIKIPKENLFGVDDHTERGRSFMFLSLGAISASALGAKTKLYVPENGMISLNIPLTPLRIGSHSTRTTHPYYIQSIQQLFNNLGLGVEIVNPFQFKTKGEMLAECSNKKLVETTETMSCSHPSGRYERQGNGHCGSCVPCIIRRASFMAAGVKDTFRYRRDIFQSSGVNAARAEGADILAFKYMIEKVKKHPKYLIASIRNTGPLGEDVTDYIDVYSRALKEVETLLSPVKLI